MLVPLKGRRNSYHHTARRKKTPLLFWKVRSKPFKSWQKYVIARESVKTYLYSALQKHGPKALETGNT